MRSSQIASLPTADAGRDRDGSPSSDDRRASVDEVASAWIYGSHGDVDG
jgi:hypothetical protein